MKKNFICMVIVQIGANNGYDDLTPMISPDDFLLLVEPYEEFNNSLKECYKHIEKKFIENIVITDDEDKNEISFFSHRNMDIGKYESSVFKSHISKHYKGQDDGIIENKFNCLTLNKLFDKYNLKDIDILYIDTEGFDDRIIKSINFNKFNIEKIFYENVHIDSESIIFYLIENGYTVEKKIYSGGWTDYAVKKKEILNTDIKFSIITPTYKRTESLKRCIDSVLKQTYPNFEMLICSDGHDPNVKNLIDKYSDNRLRYLYVEESNDIGTTPRNYSIKNSIGDFVIYLDDDNIIYQNCLNTIKSNIEKDISMIIFRTYNCLVQKIIPVENEIKHKNIDSLSVSIKRDIAMKNKWQHIYEHDLLFIKDCENTINNNGLKIKYIDDLLGEHLVSLEIDKPKNLDFVINLNDEERIVILSNLNLENVTINIRNKNGDIIFVDKTSFQKELSYWCVPNDKSYLKGFDVEIINAKNQKLFNSKIINKTDYSKFKGLKMFEFGDQISCGNNNLFYGASKYFWESFGIEYTSLDLTGLNGSLKRDITESIDDLGQFDIVTNFGSTEHVYPIEKQYYTFRNLHKLCKLGGYIIHHIPPIGHWLDHGPAHYSDNFFKKLSLNIYDIIHYEYVDSSENIACILMKKSENFLDKEKFPFEEIQWDDKSTQFGNYRQK